MRHFFRILFISGLFSASCQAQPAVPSAGFDFFDEVIAHYKDSLKIKTNQSGIYKLEIWKLDVNPGTYGHMIAVSTKDTLNHSAFEDGRLSCIVGIVFTNSKYSIPCLPSFEVTTSEVTSNRILVYLGTESCSSEKGKALEKYLKKLGGSVKEYTTLNYPKLFFSLEGKTLRVVNSN